MKQFTFVYLASYLLAGGAGFALMPRLSLKLLFSNTSYDDVIVRVAGMFMLTLGGLIAMMARRLDYTYYTYTILARTCIAFFLVYLYFSGNDPMFIVFLVIVLLGLLPSCFVYLKERRDPGTPR